MGVRRSGRQALERGVTACQERGLPRGRRCRNRLQRLQRQTQYTPPRSSSKAAGSAVSAHRRPASPSPRTRSLLPSSTPGGTRSEMRLLPLQHRNRGGDVGGQRRVSQPVSQSVRS